MLLENEFLFSPDLFNIHQEAMMRKLKAVSGYIIREFNIGYEDDMFWMGKLQEFLEIQNLENYNFSDTK